VIASIAGTDKKDATSTTSTTTAVAYPAGCVKTVPDDLMHAARIDGLGEFEILWRIMLPLASDGRTCDGVLGASQYPRLPFIGKDALVEVISDDEVWTALN